MSPDEWKNYAEAIGPFLPLIGVVAGGVVVGIFTVHNRRRGAVEGRVPSVTEAWEESRKLRKERDEADAKSSNLRQVVDALRALFRGYVERTQRGGDTSLTKAEQAALNLPVGSDDDWPTITPAQLNELRPNT